MFSMKEKQQIADGVEKLLLSFSHPEMPAKNPEFILMINGKEKWSWAEIKPNWTFKDDAPSMNPFNEIARELLSKEKEK